MYKTPNLNVRKKNSKFIDVIEKKKEKSRKIFN